MSGIRLHTANLTGEIVFMKLNTITLALIVFTAIQLALPKVSGATVDAFVFNEAAARASFAATFPHEPEPGFIGSADEHKNKLLLDSHRNLIFGGTGPGGIGQFGVGNDTHYTVNVFGSDNPDLLADMNSLDDLAGLPSDRFDVIIASNIPFGCFASGCFENAQRLLKPGSYLIVNTMPCDDRPLAIDSCMALFGFRNVRHRLDEFQDQLKEIGFTDDQFPFGEPVETDPCIIYQKI